MTAWLSAEGHDVLSHKAANLTQWFVILCCSNPLSCSFEGIKGLCSDSFMQQSVQPYVRLHRGARSPVLRTSLSEIKLKPDMWSQTVRLFNAFG